MCRLVILRALETYYEFCFLLYFFTLRFWVREQTRTSHIIETIQQRLAWPLLKDDAHKSRSEVYITSHIVATIQQRLAWPLVKDDARKTVGLRKLYLSIYFVLLFGLLLFFLKKIIWANFGKLFSFFIFEILQKSCILGVLWPARGHHRLSRDKRRRTVFFRALMAEFGDLCFVAAFFLTLRIRVREQTRNRHISFSKVIFCWTDGLSKPLFAFFYFSIISILFFIHFFKFESFDFRKFCGPLLVTIVCVARNRVNGNSSSSWNILWVFFLYFFTLRFWVREQTRTSHIIETIQ